MPNIINKQLFIVDTSIARPISFQIMRGETVQITCRFRDHLDPIVVAGMTATAYWHSREMAPTSWYSSNAVTLESDKAIWNWVPDFGADGAKEYEWYIKVTDSATNISYRAFGAIQMVGSPDSDPGDAPDPESNYYTKNETDAAIATATEHLVSDSVEINGHALTGDVNLTADDVGAAELIDLAAPFRTFIQYEVGDLTTYEGALYKCVTRYKGPWDASHFEEATVQEILAAKASKVSGAVENDFASFNSTGDIKDSGKKAEDFERTHAYTYITDTDNVTKAFDWSGTVTLQMIQNAGYDHDDIKAIVLGDKVTALGTSAFNFQGNLISVDFGEGIQTIGEDAFFNDYRLPSLVFPPSLQSIGQNAFANCNGVTYCLFEQKTEAQVKAMPNYGDWGILAPLTVASQQWVDNRIDNLDASDVGAVPTGRTVNGKSLSQNVTLTASDVGALPDTYTAPVASVNTKTGAVVLDGTDLLVGGNSDFAEATVEAEIVEFGTGLAQFNSYMPAEVSSSNKLADKAFVTDSITQGTAIYRGSYATKAALNAVQWQTSDPESPNFVSNNDYAVVQADESQDGGCWRYIYVIDTAQSISRWEPQYEINESPLTQAQLDALNSTATKAKIDSISGKLNTSGGTNGGSIVWETANQLKTTGADLKLYNGYLWLNNTSIVPRPASEQSRQLTLPTADGQLALKSDIPAAYTSGPEMDGTASAGSSTSYAKGDHVHPTDTSRASAASIADAFDATDTYAVGDYVMYQGQLYKCTTAHSGAWAAADFTAVTVTDEMDSAIGDINTILDTINGQSL